MPITVHRSRTGPAIVRTAYMIIIMFVVRDKHQRECRSVWSACTMTPRATQWHPHPPGNIMYATNNLYPPGWLVLMERYIRSELGCCIESRGGFEPRISLSSRWTRYAFKATWGQSNIVLRQRSDALVDRVAATSCAADHRPASSPIYKIKFQLMTQVCWVAFPSTNVLKSVHHRRDFWFVITIDTLDGCEFH